MKNSKLFRLCFVLLVSLLISKPGAAQRKIQGTVMDQEGKPLVGATVKIRGTNLGTVTDAKGDFTLVVSDNTKLEVSHINFETQGITVGSKTNFTIEMKISVTSLNDVVVIGYGTEQKKDLTGAIAKVNAKDFQKGSITTVDQLITGKIAGVSITSNGGSPGSGGTIRIRGISS